MILGATSLTRRRFAAWTRGDDGYSVTGASTDSTISGSVQPANGADLQTLPEGERQQRVIKVYTEDDLRTADDQSSTAADHVVVPSGVWAGTYEVRSVQSQTAILPHTKAICVRVPA